MLPALSIIEKHQWDILASKLSTNFIIVRLLEYKPNGQEYNMLIYELI